MDRRVLLLTLFLQVFLLAANAMPAVDGDGRDQGRARFEQLERDSARTGRTVRPAAPVPLCGFIPGACYIAGKVDTTNGSGGVKIAVKEVPSNPGRRQEIAQ